MYVVHTCAYKYILLHIQVTLHFQSGTITLATGQLPSLVSVRRYSDTFDELTWPIKGLMEDAGVIKLYELSQTRCLHVAPAGNMVGRIPTMPCFLDGNMTPTILHKYNKNKNSCFPAGCADSAAEDGSLRRSNNRYEVTPKQGFVRPPDNCKASQAT
jgi:hypothetical protein